MQFYLNICLYFGDFDGKQLLPPIDTATPESQKRDQPLIPFQRERESHNILGAYVSEYKNANEFKK